MRQTGSAFKPFVYATALDLGSRFDDMILDAPLTIDVPGSGPYSPSNFSDEFYGEVTLTEALARSLNIPAVRLSETVGRDLVRTVASEFGIESDLADGPALALGASESTLLEMTGAYSGILNGGSAVRPYGLQEVRIVGDDRPLLEQRTGLRDRVDLGECGATADVHDASCRRHGHRAARRPARARGRRQDRHHAGRARRVVRRLHGGLRGRRLDGV